MEFDKTFGHYPGKSSRDKMINYIKRNYQSVLGDDIKLLDEDDGLAKIRNKYVRR